MSGTELLAAIAIGAQAGGSMMRGITAYQSARLQAAIARQEGDAALRASEVEQDQMLTEGDRVIGEARAAAAGSGFDLAGSAGDILSRLAAERSAAARMAMDDGSAARQAAYLQARELNRAGRQELLGATVEAAGSVAAGMLGIQQQRRAETRHRETMERNRLPPPPPNKPPKAPRSPTSRPYVVKPPRGRDPWGSDLLATLPPMTGRTPRGP